ncbi:TPA: GNAT family N-acetyltransferase [Streptococcus pneumoniae]|nr:GNAT family N-acetyltransferase [Streptococcus pneumoniae]
MKIRQARLEDLDRIVELEFENFSVEEAIPPSVFEAHLREIQTSFLVAEKEGRIMGYISVTCLSIAKEAQGLGLGQKLLTALKEVALEDERDGINLTCHDYLIAYYEKHGFVNEGQSQSTFAGETWYDMVWEMKK